MISRNSPGLRTAKRRYLIGRKCRISTRESAPHPCHSVCFRRIPVRAATSAWRTMCMNFLRCSKCSQNVAAVDFSPRMTKRESATSWTATIRVEYRGVHYRI